MGAFFIPWTPARRGEFLLSSVAQAGQRTASADIRAPQRGRRSSGDRRVITQPEAESVQRVYPLGR